MIDLKPQNQISLFGLDKFFFELINLFEQNRLPNKMLFSGQKGIGKSTMAYHLINYTLSKNEEYSYDLSNLKINPENSSFKTIINKSNPNFILIDINSEKKNIDINQIRELILILNKSSFNNKPRIVLIDNIDSLNLNSLNALLKIIEEPPKNTYFILINNNKKILKTLLSRCVNFKIFLSNNESLEVSAKLLDGKLNQLINKDLINYYQSPGNIYKLILFAKENKYDLSKISLEDLLINFINDKHYKNDNLIKYLIFDFIDFYFNKISLSLSSNINEKYSFFLRKMSDTKKFNLDEESLFMEFKKIILND